MIEGIIASLVAAIIFLLISIFSKRTRDLVFKYYYHKKELKEYLNKIIKSIENPHNEVLHNIYSRFNLTKDYVRPSFSMNNGKHYSATSLISKIVATENLCFLIRGKFGTGKSAFCLYTNYNLAQLALNKNNNYLIPFYIPLKASNISESSDIHKLFDEYLKLYGLRSYKSFANFNKKQNLLVILDGFDQLDTSKPIELLKLLNDYFKELNIKRLIITTRSEYLEYNSNLESAFKGTIQLGIGEPLLKIKPFDIISIDEFDDIQLKKFIQKFLKVKEDKLNSILDKIYGNVHLPRLFRHPLILKIMLIIGGADLKGSENLDVSDLYKKYVEYWLKNDGHLNEISPEYRLQFVQDLSVSLVLSDPDQGIFLDKIRDIHGKDNNWIKYHDSITDIRRTYFDDSTRSFLIINKNKSLMFAHRSFMEYFCASALIEYLRNNLEIPILYQSKLYSNLIIWFMRSMIVESDFEWILKLTNSRDLMLSRLGFALLAGNAVADKNKILQIFLKKWETTTDIETKRHILYGIGWSGGDIIYTKPFMDFIESHYNDWINAALDYYNSKNQQRDHCIGRLRSFNSNDKEFYNNRGLYILDLGSVGRLEDIELLKPYIDPEKETNETVRKIAIMAINKIKINNNQEINE